MTFMVIVLTGLWMSGGVAAANFLPPFFEENRGQTAADVLYLGRLNGQMLAFGQDGLRWSGNGFEVGMSLGTGGKVRGVKRLPGVSNYVSGSERTRWLRGVPHFEQLRYEQVRPGVDALFYFQDGTLEYDFLVAPGARPESISMRFSGMRGALRIDAAGDLILGESGVRQRKPVAFQTRQGKRVPVAVDYVVRDGNGVGFELGEYDPALDLVIDPVVLIRGNGDDNLRGVAFVGYDIHATGDTESEGLATPGAFQASYGGAFVLRMNQSGGLIYLTYLADSRPAKPYQRTQLERCVSREVREPGSRLLLVLDNRLSEADRTRSWRDWTEAAFPFSPAIWVAQTPTWGRR